MRSPLRNSLLTCTAHREGTAIVSRAARESSGQDSDDSEDDGDYVQNKKKHGSKRRKTAPKRTQRDFEMPRFSSRNGKALPNYNEANMFSDLSGSDDGFSYDIDEEDQRAFLRSLASSEQHPASDSSTHAHSRGGRRRRRLCTQTYGRSRCVSLIRSTSG